MCVIGLLSERDEHEKDGEESVLHLDTEVRGMWGQAGVGSNLTGYLRYLRLLLLKEKVKRMIIMSKRKAVNNQGIVL